MLLKGCNDLKKLPSEMQNLINLRHLDIRWTSVEVMPQGMEKLRSLRTLSDFVVGEGNEVGITALENLKFLRGALRISRLDNVANASNVSGTILLDKGRIDDLEMACGTSYLASRSVSIANEERVVLEKMKPHESLEKLTIIDYGGIQFPSWVGDPLFRNLVCLELKYCKCTTLPQLGLLSSLKDLVIIGFPNVKAVDCEFCGESMSSSNPFPALETLRFEDMKEWKEWNICGCEFRLLRELSIVYCPELLGKLPSHLPSLQTLEIRECYGLVVSFQNLPSISHFQIQGCRKVELRGGFSAANFLMVSKVESFLFGSEELEQGLRKLKSLTVGNNYFYPHSRPHWVLFEGIAKRGKLLRKGLADCQIKNLEFVCCKGLKKLPPWIDSFKSLRKLSIGNCPGLISLPDAVIYKSLCLEELKIDECEDLISIGRHQLPTTLKRLEIHNCCGLQRLLDARETCSSSRFTDKEGISCDAYSSNLQHLGIIGCRSLTFLGELPVFDNNTSLESIEIKFAPHLKSLPENLHMLTNLRRIFIYHCEGLEALPDGMHNLTSLQELAIMNCPNVVSFPQGGLPTTHLKKIILTSCGKLEALPDNMHNLTSLEVLDMEDCPGIMSFPEEGFPTNLKSLSIYEVEICTSLLNWGLHRLTSLEKLRIAGGCPGVVSFPQDEIDMKLSNSLTSLTIEGLQDLKYLSSKGFQSLTSLEYLVIKGCPKLASFPKNGLPSSLLSLHIYNCPQLEQKCLKGKVQELLELARIPEVTIKDNNLKELKLDYVFS
ncbi:putative disease resistance protein At3g14460 [Hevea brasiliensis]|uniref:putative disease resistance protein At3g14460 n=1 Tax=Hevea brasiliensis TaxID=3981 RepID=UPI0025F25B58|nr:putative disease resistance protein At3g14460 [Hevea brasiliensis]